MYAKAFQVLDLVNKERAKQGLSPLTMDSSLLDTAMQRGFENVLYWSHTRPSGQDCFSANSLMMGENIAMGPDAAGQVMNLWMNSEGHRNNICQQDSEVSELDVYVTRESTIGYSALVNS